MQISKIERNRVYMGIKRAGLDLDTCTLTENDSKRLTVVHRPSKSSLRIEVRGLRGRSADIYPHVAGRTPPLGLYMLEDWDGLDRVAQRWAGEVRAQERRVMEAQEKARTEAAMPDLWSLPSSWDIPNTQQTHNTPFTPDEQAQIARRLREIKEEVKSAGALTAEQFARVEERLAEAEEASHRVGRKDWVLLFSGVVLTWMVADLVPPHIVQHIFTAVIQGLSHMLSGPSGHPMIKP